MKGYGVANENCIPPHPPTSVYEERATEWFKAKERLGQASYDAAEASRLLDEAREAERCAWSALEEAAERVPQAACATVGRR